MVGGSVDVFAAIDRAPANGTPMVLSYVDDDGYPALSRCGSVQVWDAGALCAWIRNASSGPSRPTIRRRAAPR